MLGWVIKVFVYENENSFKIKDIMYASGKNQRHNQTNNG
jgi:hypothetical protein